MLDSTFDKFILSADKTETGKIHRDITVNAINKYNPIEIITGNIPISCFETCALLCDIDFFPCSIDTTSTTIICVDMDETCGFAMAVEGKFERSLCYSLSGIRNKNDKWQVSNQLLDFGRIDYHASCAKSLCARVLMFHPSGISLSYLTLDNSANNPNFLENRIAAACNALGHRGSCIIRWENYDNDLQRKYLNRLFELFDQVICYKPAVTSCISKCVYVVGYQKNKETSYYDVPMDVSSKIDGSIEKIENERLQSLASIQKRKARYFNLDGAKARYLSKLY